MAKEGRLPDVVMACVGGGSNAMGLFSGFLEDEEVRVIGVEPAGEGLSTARHAATMTKGTDGTLHGMATVVLQEDDGEPSPVHSIASGLDYPGVGPQHAWLKDVGRAEYVSVTDDDTLEAFSLLCRTEGIIPALESSHALAHAMRIAPEMSADEVIVVNLSGRGDKDVDYIASVMRDR